MPRRNARNGNAALRASSLERQVPCSCCCLEHNFEEVNSDASTLLYIIGKQSNCLMILRTNISCNIGRAAWYKLIHDVHDARTLCAYVGGRRLFCL